MTPTLEAELKKQVSNVLKVNKEVLSLLERREKSLVVGLETAKKRGANFR